MKSYAIKATLAAVALSATLLPATLEAATTPLYIIAGSSALFNTFGYANFELNSGGFFLTGKHHWSFKSAAPNTILIHDGRSVNITDEPGTVWVAWNDDEVASPKGPNPQLSAYIQVDSAVGVRAALAVPSASLVINAPALTAGQNKVPNTTLADEPLPAVVLADLNSAPTINIAAADIRAEDAKFATARTLTAQGTHVGNSTRTLVTGLGYGGAFGPSIGFPIKSSRSTAIANPVDFALFGTDPITGNPAYPNITELNVGAGPVIVFVNTTNTATGHYGNATLTNVPSWSLSGLVDGTFSRTRDIFTTPGLPAVGARTFIREPLSGTYNTFEYNIPNTDRQLSTQEVGVINVTPGSGSAQNPLNETVASGGGRSRAIGTGEEVSAVTATPDSLGYAFWGYGNFNAITPAVSRYLTVDGVDPLFTSYAANPISPGAFPQKTGATYPVITFPNVANGSYPIWTTFRVVVPTPGLVPLAKVLVSVAQGDASLISDFVPSTSLAVFRSHYFQANIGGDNGHRSGVPVEQGGDVGGAIFPVQADLDYINDTGLQLLQRLQ